MKEKVIFVGKPSFNINRGNYDLINSERESLIDLLDSQKIPLRVVPLMWPRDEMVFAGNVIHRRKDYGNYADGGYVVVHPEFVMTCEGVSTDDEGIQDTSEQRNQKMRDLYQKPVEILPNPNFSLNPELRPHVDMVVLAIPERKVAFVDKTYYIQNRRDIENFCERTSLKLETVLNDYSRPTWPCNTLMTHGFGGLKAISGSSDPEFIAKLRKYEIELLFVPFKSNSAMGGSVHCATNVSSKELAEEAFRVFYE